MFKRKTYTLSARLGMGLLLVIAAVTGLVLVVASRQVGDSSHDGVGAGASGWGHSVVAGSGQVGAGSGWVSTGAGGWVGSGWGVVAGVAGPLFVVVAIITLVAVVVTAVAVAVIA